MPLVWVPVGASGHVSLRHPSGDGKYSPLPSEKTMWGTMPLAHWAAKSDVSSVTARSGRRYALPMAMNAESQLH